MAQDKRDANQVLRAAARELSTPTDIALATQMAGGSLVPEEFDQITLTYVAAGNGVGEIETAEYRNNGSLIATLTLSYDASNRLIDVVRS